MRNEPKHTMNHVGSYTIQNDESESVGTQLLSSDKWLVSDLFTKQTSDLMSDFRDADPVFYNICLRSNSLQNARELILEYLNSKESEYFELLSSNISDYNITERNNAKECIRVLKNIIRTENERLTKFSALQALRNAIQHHSFSSCTLSHSFLCEIIALLHGINGRGLSFLPRQSEIDAVVYPGNQKSNLDSYANTMADSFQRYAAGTAPELILRREEMINRILHYFQANESDWKNYQWHLTHILKNKDDLEALVHLSDDEKAGLDMAKKEGIPVQITPYYLSLFNPDGRDDTDRAVRAQVLPTAAYCKKISSNRKSGSDMDYMGEHYTSPIEGITRRYPEIVILKPFDSCPQICVYCQRNWEIRDLDHGNVSNTTIQNAINWIKNHTEINEVLVTGGDPLTLNNSRIGKLLDQLADIDHIERIRIGTRTLVTIPCRIDNGLTTLLRTYHKIGRREITIMTHFEHSTELTPEVIEAVNKIRQCGISIYNQQVFTYFNSRKFETAYLRKNLKLCGIDPYYTFNTKGKEETADFRVPIARLLQERKEEARLLPGVSRTDEPVFNVPRIGKSHLRAWQDHEPIMILADGRRVYRFFPWNSRLTLSNDYLYTDVSIYDYLKRLFLDGEEVNQYRSIWYYF